MFYFFEELTTKLTTTECLVYSLIHSIYFRNIQEDEERIFYASNNYIAARLNLSRSTVINSLKSLEQKGYLELIYGKNADNVTTRTIIPQKIDINNELEFEKNLHGGSKKTRQGVVKNQHEGSIISTKGVVQKRDTINKYIDNKYINKLNIDISPDLQKLDSPDKNTTKAPRLDYQAVKDKWNAIAQRYHLQSINTVTTQRATALKARFYDIGGEDAFWATVENAIKNSPFLRGQNNRKWRASFDWVITQSRFVKLAEGVYSSGSSLLDDPQKPIQEAANKDWIDDFFTFEQEAK